MHKIILAGEDSILIYFGSKINSALPKNIANFANTLKVEFSQLIINLTPSYTSLLVHYDLSKVNYLTFSAEVQNLLTNFEFSNTTEDSNLICIPVYYGFESGLDLERLLAEKNLNLDEFIEIHSDQEYLVYAIGFSPVFAFLGEVDMRIQAPRLATPRIKIPAGSVGIADSQTAVYPTDSSGGWNIIGRTVQDLSLKNPDNLNKFKTGDQVKFYPITREEFIEYGGQL
ncbi:Allophanate hydrolase 2 subunit 1 [uncultured Candidatus Thioglobus sp.]|nr:Allophanate hydrolase 2 subunit 1 [uncultured Candidatus Thioglobus sp.]